MRILKMLLRLISLPALVASLVVHVLLALVIGLSSIVTNLIGTFFIFGSIAGWITHAAPTMVWQTVGIGIFFFIRGRKQSGEKEYFLGGRQMGDAIAAMLMNHLGR